jgi:putative SOS response-associated peptidase YedK
MCGRYLLISPVEAMRRLFDVGGLLNLPARYNIAPTQDAPVVRLDRELRRELIQMRWGLIPAWAKDAAIGQRCINARAETLAEKPAFREAFRRRRCLVPADGFFEWQRKGGQKLPWRIGLADGGLTAFAGLWEGWRGPDGNRVRSFAIVTTAANRLVAPLHDRMPAMLAPDAFAAWLDPQSQAPGLTSLLQPFPAELMTAHPVSRRVNDVRNDDPDCIRPLEEGPQMRLL